MVGLLEQWRMSGESGAAFCRRHGIKPQKLSYWKRVLAKSTPGRRRCRGLQPMRFKVDENLPIEVAEVLRAAGHEAATVNDEGIGGAHDPDIESVLRHENRAILTLDVGFADIRLHPPREYPGIVVLRLPRQDKEPLAGRLWIVEADRIRVRSSEG